MGLSNIFKMGKQISNIKYSYNQLKNNEYIRYLAGAGGFEPPNAGIKSRCLRPLGYAPTLLKKSESKCHLKRRAIYATSFEDASVAKPKDHFFYLLLRT
jgi:hypothetical protein